MVLRPGLGCSRAPAPPTSIGCEGMRAFSPVSKVLKELGVGGLVDPALPHRGPQPSAEVASCSLGLLFARARDPPHSRSVPLYRSPPQQGAVDICGQSGRRPVEALHTRSSISRRQSSVSGRRSCRRGKRTWACRLLGRDWAFRRVDPHSEFRHASAVVDVPVRYSWPGHLKDTSATGEHH
jgi:hypothetical protein